MNIAVDKTNKTITIYEEITWENLVDCLHDMGLDSWSTYTIIPPPQKTVIEYVPVYPQPMTVPFIYPYPVYPSPTPYYPPYTITCTIKGNVA